MLQECQAGSCGRVDVSLKDALTAKAKAIVYAFSPTDVNLSSCITPWLTWIKTKPHSWLFKLGLQRILYAAFQQFNNEKFSKKVDILLV